MALKYKDRLLKHLNHDDYEPKAIDALATELRVDDFAEFADAVRDLAGEGLVLLDKGERVSLPHLDDQGELVGIFRGSAKGFGFVEPGSKTLSGDVFIPPNATAGALSGDTVRIAYSRDKRRERQVGGLGRSYAGEVLEVVERKRSSFAGEMDKRDGRWLCYPDGKNLTEPVVIRDAESKNVRPGDKVVIELTEYPGGGGLAQGVITRVLGEAGRPDVETQAVIAAYNLPSNEFPAACNDQAREATRRFDEEIAAWEKDGPSALELREDRTGEFVTTIDPPDAKDYDDAISLQKLNRKEHGFDGWELRVHIADVSHFVLPGTALDTEGKDRANSCYLPRLVIPMLPEILSNGICSLQEGVPRYAKTAIMRYDTEGNVRGTGVCSSLIKSRKRMTYLEAQALIEGNLEEARKQAKTDTEHSEELIASVREMDKLARTIRERRKRQGMIHLDLPDVELVFDEDGKVIDAEPEDDAFTHTLIEMFMVEANECLARLFADLGVPLLRRVHPEPTPGDSDVLRKTAKVAGFTIPDSPSREELQALLDATSGTPASRAVHMAVLRTLTKAQYSPALIGHFALASNAYAHFTSPIRRFPDLTVHRALAEYLRHTKNGTDRPKDDGGRKKLGAKLREVLPDEQELLEVGNHCTNREINAEHAERELRQFLVLQLLAEQLASGENPEHAGVITGVNPRGVFVQLERYLCDGMIKKEDLPGDTTRDARPPRWKIDDRTGALTDQNSGRSYAIGDTVRVTVAQVDLARRKMDLVITDAASRAAGKRKGPMGLTLGGAGGGLEGGGGAGFKSAPGATRRSAKSKRRDKGKQDFRADRKGKGKRQ
ncbi:MAG: VacB/RNase II family 3'-5' exoribonuclease [Planctomycetota bacterium]